MKKSLSLTLAVLMVVSMIPTAFATTNYMNGTQVEYIADADANREYTITVPALLNPGQSGTVTLKGKWASNETVKVTADATVELTNSINSNDKKVLNIGFNGIEKAGDNTVERTYTENVSVAAMPADALFGTWSGKFNYNVEFDDGRAPTVMFYDVKYINDNGKTYVKFHKDGSMDLYYIEGETSSLYSSVSSLTYDGQNLTSDFLNGHFSEDGKIFYQHTSKTDSTVRNIFIYTP